MVAPRSSGPFLTDIEREFLRTVVLLALINPFGHGRIPAERAAVEIMGGLFVEVGRVMSRRKLVTPLHPNVVTIGGILGPLLDRMRAQLADGKVVVSDADRQLYHDACTYYVYDKYDADKIQTIFGKETEPVPFYPVFKKDVAYYLGVSGLKVEPARDLLAYFFQLRRAYYYTFNGYAGSSDAAVAVRVAIWNTLFTTEMKHYLGGLHARMNEISTLVTGPTGSGKDEVARIIAYSQFIPVIEEANGSAKFEWNHLEGYRRANLSEGAASLIESEVFGHVRGAFTGATDDREGLLEKPGTVFIDEIGDLVHDLQVKLLRVLENREFHRLGEWHLRKFDGRFVFATHRDLDALIEQGRFREDLYHRLNDQEITTPTLHEQLLQAPDDLYVFVRLLAEKVSTPALADYYAAKAMAWIQANVPASYMWPGNFRELRRCVRRVMATGEYKLPKKKTATQPTAARHPDDEAFFQKFEQGALKMADVERYYVTLAVANGGTKQETAEQLGISRTTMNAKLDRALLERLIKRR